MVFGSLEPPPSQAYPALAGTFSTPRSEALGDAGAEHDKALGVVTLDLERQVSAACFSKIQNN